MNTLFGGSLVYPARTSLTIKYVISRTQEEPWRWQDEENSEDSERCAHPFICWTTSLNKIRCTTGICGRWQHLARISSYDDEIKWIIAPKRQWRRERTKKKNNAKKNENEKRRRKIDAKISTIHYGKLLVGGLAPTTAGDIFFLLILKRIKNCTFKLPGAAQNLFLRALQLSYRVANIH